MAMDRAYLDFERLIKSITVRVLRYQEQSNTRLRRIYSAPVDKADGVQVDQTVMLIGYKSRKAYPDPFVGCAITTRTKTNVWWFLRTTFLSGQDGRRYLSLALAGRAVLQVDQATLADQVVLRDISQCGQDPNLDRSKRLSPRGDCQEEIESSGSLHTILQILEVNLLRNTDFSAG